MQAHLQNTFDIHRGSLTRWFTKLTADAYVAEDLAQETLVEAWKNQHKLIDPEGVRPWINAIGANIYKRWCRQQGREQKHIDLADEMPGSSSVEVELEHSELISLLDEALELLPPETQALLTARYLEELPYAQLAKSLGTTENVVAVRLHRGKLMLRELMDAEQTGDRWQTTRLWCFTCGCTLYESKFNPTTGELHMRCPRCNPVSQVTAWSHTDIPNRMSIKGLKSLKPALNRLMQAHHDYYRPALGQTTIPCEACGTETDLHRTMPSFIASYVPGWLGVHYQCRHCGNVGYTGLSGVVLSSAQGQHFWNQHPRMYKLPHQTIEHEGREALVMIWQSLNSEHQFSAIFAQDNYEILLIDSEGDHE